jgi:glycosyltransferase involved in cell wall biosynthesis
MSEPAPGAAPPVGAPRICILSFSPIHRDARVLRQIEYLAPRYRLTVIGYGPPVARWPDVEWAMVATRSNAFTRLSGLALLALGRVAHPLYRAWYWQKPHHRQALRHALAARADAYHANDWHALPVAAEAARRRGARLVLDAHEYAPAEFEDRRGWRLLYRPLVTSILRRYSARLDATMTVARPIAERYRAVFGWDPLVVLNAPKLVPLPPRRGDPARIRLVHHGGASPDRRLETMIETLALTDPRFELHFILVDDQSEYIRGLKRLAAARAPDRIHFHDPVPPAEIVPRIAGYDIGFYLLEPTNYNNQVALPNKFFDFLAAGLAVCVGPSGAMAQMVEEHGFGCVTPSYDPAAAAATLNALTSAQIAAMQAAARATAARFNADSEMRKVVALYDRLLGGPGA